MINKTFSFLGDKVNLAAVEMGQAVLMLRSCLFWFFSSKLELKQAFIHAVRIGVDSLPVALLTSFFTGMVLALQSGSASQDLFNEPLYLGTLVGFTMTKELGPVLTAIVIAGRAGSAMTAEIGTMRVTEQIDALYTLGTNPVRYLVIPRYVAAMLTIPLLTVCSIFSGVFGGFFISTLKLGVPSFTFWDEILTYMDINDFIHGFSKSFLFAFVIVTICCHKGLITRGGAEGVGKATTGAVVVSMVSVLVLDYFATALLVSLGI